MLERYRLEERLGAGGFGTVWRALDERLEREVAVKAIPRGDGGVGDRSAREARAAARLNHPAIVALYETGADEEAVYLVSELVHGRTFAELGRASALSDRDIGRIGVALSEALTHAHARGVIHRDVKPQNVIVVAEPAAGAGFAKLADFGVAHLVGDDPLTRTGDIVGTLAYMAPEQAEGLVPTGACDVYSLALTLYEGLAGENPMRGRSPAETARLVGGYAPPLRDLRRDLPTGLCRALDACLEPRPEHRPGIEELGEWLDGSLERLESRGGLVEPGTLARFGLLRRGEQREEPTPRTAHLPSEARAEPPPAVPDHPAPVYLEEPRYANPPPPAYFEQPHYAEPPAPPDPYAPPATSRWLRLMWRVAAGLGAGALTVALLAVPAADPPVAPAPAAAVVAAIVALLPRLGWLAAVTLLLAWLALGAGLEGGALLILVALAPTPLLLPRAGTLWSVPALAPLLAMASVGPAYVGLAGLAATPLRRAGLGAAGYLWLAGAEAFFGDILLHGAPDAVPAPSGWEGSLAATVTDAMVPHLTTPALLPALAWGAFAALLPLAVRGRSTKLDLLRGAVWAGGLIAVLLSLSDLLAGSGAGESARGAAIGPVVGLVLALAVATLRADPSGPALERSDRGPTDGMGRPIVA